MSSYIIAYICKTANVITYVTAHLHVAPICPYGRLVSSSCGGLQPLAPTEGSSGQKVISADKGKRTNEGQTKVRRKTNNRFKGVRF